MRAHACGNTLAHTRPTARHGTARHGTARHGTARHGTARHGTARHGTAKHPTARPGRCAPAWQRWQCRTCRFVAARTPPSWPWWHEGGDWPECSPLTGQCPRWWVHPARWLEPAQNKRAQWPGRQHKPPNTQALHTSEYARRHPRSMQCGGQGCTNRKRCSGVGSGGRGTPKRGQTGQVRAHADPPRPRTARAANNVQQARGPLGYKVRGQSLHF
jgi:hypothetical protein